MVFLSHSSKDKEFVRELYRRLTRDGVECFFDEKSIEWGDNFVLKLEEGIDKCDVLVLVLSPDFCASKWAQIERTSSMADDPDGVTRKLRPLVLHPCDHLPTFPRFLKEVQSVDVSTATFFESNYSRICEKLGGVVRDEAILNDRTKLPPVHPLPAKNRMPYRSLDDKFVGRVEEIWKLHDSLFRDRTTVLQGRGVVAGTGGLGKTQLAIEYAHRFGHAYQGGVYWVNADQGIGTLITQVSEAAQVEINTKAKQEEQTQQLWRELNTLGKPYLVILDNFPESEPLEPYLPTAGRVHTIITTRRRDLKHDTVGLPMLSATEGARLLNGGGRSFGTDAETLSQHLGGLPLALELAKSFLDYRKSLSVNELLREMKSVGDLIALEKFASKYGDQLPSGHELDVVKTFQMSWTVAPENAKKVLRAMGELAPAPVPRKLLRAILDFSEQSALEDELNDSLDELVRLSLVELDQAGNPFAHRLILGFARYRNFSDIKSPLARSGDVIYQQMRRTFDNPGVNTFRELELVLPHAEFFSIMDRLESAQVGKLLNSVGEHHRQLGRYTQARDASSKALAYAEKSFEPGHPSLANMQSNLAVILQDLGELEEARDLLQKALASDEKSYESGHPAIAIRQSNLALVLQDLGELEEARDLMRKALASAEQSFEQGHPAIARRESNLAVVLQVLGELEEARDLLRKALASDEKSYESGHPAIATRQSNLALVLKDLGELTEARDLMWKAYAAFLERLGPGHRHTKVVKNHLDSLPPKPT